MEKDFIKEVNVLDRKHIDIYKEIMGNIEIVKKNLERDYTNLQFADDKNLVDFYTYRIKSEEAQYDYLINQAKRIETGLYL